MNIVITGASQGIGYETAWNLAQSGKNKIIAIARNQQKLNKLKEKALLKNTPGKIIPYAFDLRNTDRIDELSSFCNDKLGTIHLLINNAGLLHNKKYLDFTNEEIAEIFTVNFFSVDILIRKLLPFFDKKGGKIINISSLGGKEGTDKFPGLSIYSASKGALNILSECLAVELQPYNIDITSLSLGAVETEMFQKAFPGQKALDSPERIGKWISDMCQ